ncbi:MAG: transcriptional repressor [Verrucomicrobia bacterium]|nr:transcriptional repressor [Verrucomicrobiota bacterium]
MVPWGGLMDTYRSQLMPGEVVRRALHAAGLRCTPQRQAVFEELTRLGGHVSADMLAERFRRRRGRAALSRATVYRTLALLQQCGLVREVLFTESHSHYEAVTSHEHHEHMVCTACGRAIEFDDSDLERVLAKAARAKDFSLISHRIEIYGLCDRCR